MRPSKASCNCGSFPRKVPRANSLSVCASLSPWMIALIMLCPLLPQTSDTTLVNLILAVSKILCSRLICWVC